VSDNPRPFDTLEEMLGEDVVVVRDNDPNVRGVLKAFDKHINLALDGADVKKTNQRRTLHDTFFVRGAAVVDVHPQDKSEMCISCGDLFDDKLEYDQHKTQGDCDS